MFGIYLLTFFILELVYFRIADHFNIIDHPNKRSSHTKVTLRGGGIIFPLAVVLSYFITQQYSWFLVGLTLISLVSFWDDVKSLPNLIRITIHFLSVILLILQLDLDIPAYWYPLVFILIIGMINAYNFMDGINGITGMYSLITLCTLLYINTYIVPFTSQQLLIAIIASILVFNFFNFRKIAKCFAGDIGSVSMAFIISFLLIQLIAFTGNFLYVGILLLYGLDAVTTIVFRLFRRENIFQAHRSHFYQYLSNERKWTHLKVAALYGVLQILLNIFLLISFDAYGSLKHNVCLGLMILLGAMILISIRLKLEGRLLYKGHR